MITDTHFGAGVWNSWHEQMNLFIVETCTLSAVQVYLAFTTSA